MLHAWIACCLSRLRSCQPHGRLFVIVSTRSSAILPTPSYKGAVANREYASRYTPMACCPQRMWSKEATKLHAAVACSLYVLPAVESKEMYTTRRLFVFVSSVASIQARRISEDGCARSIHGQHTLSHVLLYTHLTKLRRRRPCLLFALVCDQLNLYKELVFASYT